MAMPPMDRDPLDGRPGNGGRPRADAARRQRSRRASTPKTDLFHADVAHEPISRYAFVAGFLGLLGVAATARLADYQIFNAEHYRWEADVRRLLDETLYAKRGTMYDRNGNVITSSVECKNVCFNLAVMDDNDRKEAVRAVVDVLGVDEDYARACSERTDVTWVCVKSKVDIEEADKLTAKGIRGIETEQAMKRVYPYGELASQVIGTVDPENAGTSGLELQYDKILTGENGKLVREHARDGSYIAGGAYHKEPAKDGTDIVLSLDMNVQRAAEEALAKAVEDSGAKYGSAIVCDPRTGEILAACSSPTFDPSDRSDVKPEDMNLRLVTDVYEPGSVFKVFVCAAALETKTVSTSTSFQVPAKIKVGDDMVGDADDRDYSMTMDMREILRRSSNTGMVLVGRKLGADNLASYIEKFGFGTKSGVDFPGESLGIIKKRSEYDGASLGSMSFGQSLAVAPIEMVRAMTAIANGGVMTTPHFLMSRGGEEMDWTDGEERAISAKTASKLADMMQTVVDEGTGSDAQLPGYRVAGKTGTAERAAEGVRGYQEGNNMASFMGFVSTDDPRVLCYVTLDGTGATSHAAQPAFKTTMQAALDALGIKAEG